MTAQPETPPPFPYYPPRGSDAERYLDQLDAAKAAVTEAETHLRDLVKQIEAEVAAGVAAQLPRGATLPPVITIPGGPHRQGRVMRWVVQRRFNSKRFRAEQPVLYETYREYGDGYWQLDPEKGAS